MTSPPATDRGQQQPARRPAAQRGPGAPADLAAEQQAGQPRRVGEHVDGHHAEPQHERGLVQQAATGHGRGPVEGQRHAGADHRHAR